jgi:SsrA-binding protein
MAKSDKTDEGLHAVTRNRKASHQYELSDRLECGIVLVGTEVKSLRGELWLVGCEIPEYAMGNRLNHKPKRDRKLLLHRREIAKFAGKASERGYTLIPTRVYFKNGRAKVEVAIARGKQLYDKRHALKTAEAKREIDRATKRRR